MTLAKKKKSDDVYSFLENELKIRIPIIIFKGNIVSELPLNITNTRKKMAVNARGSSKDQK